MVTLGVRRLIAVIFDRESARLGGFEFFFRAGLLPCFFIEPCLEIVFAIEVEWTFRVVLGDLLKCCFILLIDT
ncbi:hypothetical protein C447_02647 [Halococcus hamelinensis 100A6]|uniref:Uncharacterized protein n=1 Tax=Halococcus hamelinensis 100A6 TaxID=1132509 RepID=M0M9J6_9EURY|nr:hypothetical protein C447_02647 [Halococcus hamelinensis 100A6]